MKSWRLPGEHLNSDVSGVEAEREAASVVIELSNGIAVRKTKSYEKGQGWMEETYPEHLL